MISIAKLPPPVRPGDRIGVAALSGKVDPARLDAGLVALAVCGYEPVEASNLRTQCGLFAGSDRQRLDAFHDLASDDNLSAIIFARGGYGVTRILPDIDWDLLASHPRAYVGYSDLTPFLLQVVARLGLVAFHGPMVAADFARGLTEEEQSSFEMALSGTLPARFSICSNGPGEGRLEVSGSEDGLPEDSKSKEVVEGPLLGGCLSMLTATLGTPFAPDLEGAILFLEDLGEPLYRFDRMLTHLRLSGNLSLLKGVVAGHLEGEDCEPSLGASQATLVRQLQVEAEGFPWPLAWGLAAGHARPNLTLPLGLWARVDPDAGELMVG